MVKLREASPAPPGDSRGEGVDNGGGVNYPECTNHCEAHKKLEDANQTPKLISAICLWCLLHGGPDRQLQGEKRVVKVEEER